MTSLLHSLHIGTLATWLSVAGFGTLAVIVPARPTPANTRQEKPANQLPPQDFTLGNESAPTADEPPAAPTIPEPAASWPTPPTLPDLTESPPLPDIPTPPPSPLPPAPAATESPTPDQPTKHLATRRQTPRPNTNTSNSTIASGQTADATSESNSTRLAAGTMPPPDYPAEARRLGQTGTIIVEFTVDTAGRVIAAYAKSPSPWPLLDTAAVHAVRNWHFPPGRVIQLQRPIVFQLR